MNDKKKMILVYLLCEHMMETHYSHREKDVIIRVIHKVLCEYYRPALEAEKENEPPL